MMKYTKITFGCSFKSSSKKEKEKKENKKGNYKALCVTSKEIYNIHHTVCQVALEIYFVGQIIQFILYQVKPR